MARLVLYMSMSLDGFVAGPEDDDRNPIGIDGMRLHAWLRDGGVDPGSHRPSDPTNARVFDEMMATGAVVAGRRTFDLAGGWNGDHHGGVPVFVPTHDPPEGPPPGYVRFVTDGIESCVAQAKAAAGDRDVMLHGASTAQQCLRAGLLDELQIHLVPVLLGEGRRLFDGLGSQYIDLDLVRTVEAPGVLHLRFRVVRP